MRYLNKIIFLNSANIPYAEVMLDGNVHFSGTQGVGKSTILRALLFFYNADKMRLGIQQGQKSYEEFYFRHGNSYIVYEVKTEHSAYSIMTSRSNGKVVFRFIDAPYRKDWFMDSSNRVTSDWIKIRDCIGNHVDISSKIDTYGFYRDIIFGNTHDRSHRFDKYALVESSKYQNIPRSIQNVFLNSKLDADFVKTTIIQSMSETEDSISLATYRHLVTDFEREFDEIDCWYKKDSSGNIAVRNIASKVVETYRLLVALDYEMRQTWHQLNYLVNFTREQIPLVEESIHKLNERLDKIKEKLNNTQDEYNKKHYFLVEKKSECETRLKDIRNKRKRYNEMNITAIIEFVGREPQILADKEHKESTLRLLQAKFRDITEKYKELYRNLDNEWTDFTILQKEEEQRRHDENLIEREKANEQHYKRKQAFEQNYRAWLVKSDERMSTLNEDHRRANRQLADLQYWHPLKQDIESCNEEIINLKTQDKELRAELSVVENELKSLQQEAQLKQDYMEQDFSIAQQAMEKELVGLQAELQSTEKLLSRWKGSLYEWLITNKPRWEETIGKVVDEMNVLYANDLTPELSEGNSIFGVNINLNAIPVHHHTPDEYRALLKEQKKAIENKNQALDQLRTQNRKELESIQKSYKNKLDEKKQEELKISLKLGQLPQKIKDTETRLRRLQEQEDKLISAEREKRTTAYNKALLNLEKEKTDRTRQSTIYDKGLNEAKRNYDAKIKELKKQFEEFTQNQVRLKNAKKADIDSRREQTMRHERDELQGKGADTNAIDTCRKEIEDIKATLDKIKSRQRYVIEYHKDIEELFSHEAEYRDEKQRLEAKDAQLQQDFDDKRNRCESEKADISAELDSQKHRLNEMNEGLKQYDRLCKIENVIPETFLNDDTEEKCNGTCVELVAQIRGVINKKRIKQEDLKHSVNSFRSHFSANNIFHFIEPQYDDDYSTFAINLRDFIENDKIEAYRERVSEHYNEILRKLSREVGLLMNHSAEIKGIINDVNRDFRERNFAGVIRSIELRTEESSDRMMQLLSSIRNFTEENSLSIGEQNLFSEDDHDLVNAKVVEYLRKFMKQLQEEPSRTELTISDTFRLQFRIQENDNNTGWVERISNIGSDGTDILVKAMVNIMLINVFKTKAARKQGDFIIHCMMDEIGKLHPSNVAGILQFANVRNIYLINSSPMGYNADIYKYNYLLTKDSKSQTHVKRLMTVNI